MSLEVVTFDLWATVLGSPHQGARARHEHRVAALSEALEASGAPVEAGHIDRLMREEWSRFDRVWREEHRTLRNEERLVALLDDLDRELERAAIEAVCEAFDASFFAGPPGISPHARTAIEGLREAGVRLGVISDTAFTTGRTMRRVLSEAGLLEHFEVLSFSDELGRSKPHPEVFARTLSGLGVSDPARALHVGDSERTDITGALDAGMRAVLYVGASGASFEETRAEEVIARLDAVLTLT